MAETEVGGDAGQRVRTRVLEDVPDLAEIDMQVTVKTYRDGVLAIHQGADALYMPAAEFERFVTEVRAIIERATAPDHSLSREI